MQKEALWRIHDRFLRDDVFRERMIQHNRVEEVCRAWDVLADEDHTYHISQEEYFYYGNNWWLHLKKSGNDTQPLRNVLISNKRCLHYSVYTKKLEENKSIRSLLEVQTMEIGIEFLLYLVAMARFLPGGLLRNSKKVKKDEASKGLWLIGATRYLQNFGENLKRMAFTSSFYFVTDRSLTADGGLL